MVRVASPPVTTTFEPLLAYLDAKPAPTKRLSGTGIGRERVAAVALRLRWGTCFAVLGDADKPVWEEREGQRTTGLQTRGRSRIAAVIGPSPTGLDLGLIRWAGVRRGRYPKRRPVREPPA